MQDFRDLKVWQKAHAMVLSIYAATKKFPPRGAIRFDLADVSSCGFDSSQYCRRVRPIDGP
jgi:hypothetical protein